MTNNTLYPKDLVRYNKRNTNLDELGFNLGQVYEVYEENGNLLIMSDLGYRGREVLVYNGSLTDSVDFFTRVNRPMVLPVGTNQGLECPVVSMVNNNRSGV